MPKWGKAKQLDPETLPLTYDEPSQCMSNFESFLRLLTASDGICIVGVGIATVISVLKNMGNTEYPVELWVGALFSGFFEVFFGLIVVAAELRWSCVVRLYGFMAYHLGKSAFLTFCGALLCSLGKAFIGNSAPLIIGFICIGTGFLHFLVAFRCLPLPTDPLKAQMVENYQIVSAFRKANKGKKKARIVSEVAVELETGGGGGKKGWFGSKKGGGAAAAPSGGDSAAAPPPEQPASNNPFKKGGGGLFGSSKAASSKGGGGGGGADPFSAKLGAASDNPFCGNKHLS